MNASVIVLGFNGCDYLPPCLRALESQGASEVIVVDNGSSDGTADLVAHDFPSARLIRTGRNLGFAAGCNTGLAAATGDLLILLNQDTIVRPGWLDALRAAATAPEAGIVGAKAFFPDGRIQHAGGVVGARGECAHLTDDPHDAGAARSSVYDVDYVTGASLAVTRGCLNAIGVLDKGFGLAYYEDVDWCFRARHAGFRVVYAPAASLIHVNQSVTAIPSPEQIYAFHCNRMRLVLKHWSAERLRGEFAPMEAEWLLTLKGVNDKLVAVMRRIYFHWLLSLAEVATWRTASETVTVAAVLADLRQALPWQAADVGIAEWPAIGTGGPPVPPTANTMPRAWTLSEPVFHSSIPLIGGLVAAFRKWFNNISTRWYVLPILEQQNRINAQARELIDELARTLEDLRANGSRADGH